METSQNIPKTGDNGPNLFDTAANFDENITKINTQAGVMDEIFKIVKDVEYRKYDELFRALGITTKKDYEGIGGFFKKISDSVTNIKKSIDEKFEWIKKHKKKIIISIATATGLGLIYYFFFFI